MPIKNVSIAAGLAAMLAAAAPAYAGAMLTDTAGSGVAVLTTDADFSAAAYAGLMGTPAGEGSVYGGQVYDFSTSAASGIGYLGISYSSSQFGAANADYEFLTADGTGVVAQLLFHYNGAGAELVSFEDFLSEPGAMPAPITDGATLIDWGAEMSGPLAGVTFTLDDTPVDVIEPASVAVFGAGVLALLATRRFRRTPARAV
jgi:hypothetical protein